MFSSVYDIIYIYICSTSEDNFNSQGQAENGVPYQ